MSVRLSGSRRSRALGVAALATSALLVLAGCSSDNGGGSTDGGSGNGDGGGEVTAENPYALPEGYSEHIIFEAGPVALDGSWGAAHIVAMADKIEELSNGQITFELSTGYAVHGATEATVSIRDGVVKMGNLAPTYEPAGWDQYVWFTTAMSKTVTSTRPVLLDLAANAASLEQGFNDPYLPAEYEKQGVYPLIPRQFMHAAYHLLCTEPVTTLAEANGMLVRTAGPNWVTEAEAVGLTPVALPPAEQFEGLQRGVVDCVMGPIRDWNLFDLFSVAHHLTIDDAAAFVGYPLALGANPAWWESLPDGAQNIIWAGAFEFAAEIPVSRVNGDRLALAQVAGAPENVIHPMEDDLRDTLTEFQATKVDTMLENVPAGADPEVLAGEIDFMTEQFESWMAYLEEEETIGGFFAPTWSEFAAQAADLDEIVLPTYKERLWEEVFLPRMPHPGN